MNVIEMARKLGAEIQKDERYIRYAKARLENDNNESLQNLIGEFNITRMQLDSELNSENKSDDKVRELNEKLRSVYSEVMSCESMVEYNTAKAEVDSMLNDVNAIIGMCVAGEDPETCEISDHQCSSSCSSCGGCH